MLTNLLLLGLVLLIAALVTGLMRSYALRGHLLDTPNERSSHTVPTPRGGGIGIVVTFVAASSFLALSDQVPAHVFAALAFGGLLVAGIGFVDDHRNLTPKKRIAIHIFASFLALVLLGGMPSLNLGFATVEWGWLGHVVGLVGIVWMTNLFNFMDGIDGITGAETAFIGTTAGILLLVGGKTGLAVLSMALAAASLGFLAWNWHPAKIFMGDVGSSFIGYVVAVLAIASARIGGVSLWVWLLLAAVFIVDATITVIRRVIRGEKWYLPHRTHAYQHAAKMYRSHAKVTLGIGAINALLLLPLVLFIWRWPSATLPVTIIAGVLLVTLALRFQAGVRDPEPGNPSAPGSTGKTQHIFRARD